MFRQQYGPLIPLFFVSSFIAFLCVGDGFFLSLVSLSGGFSFSLVPLGLFGMSLSCGILSGTLLLNWRQYMTARGNLNWSRLSAMKRVFFFCLLVSPLLLAVFYSGEASQWWDHEKRIVPIKSEVFAFVVSVAISVVLLLAFHLL